MAGARTHVQRVLCVCRALCVCVHVCAVAPARPAQARFFMLPRWARTGLPTGPVRSELTAPPRLGPAPQLSGQGAGGSGRGRGLWAQRPGRAQAGPWGAGAYSPGCGEATGSRGEGARDGAPLYLLSLLGPLPSHTPCPPQAWLALLTSVRLSVWPAGQSLLDAGLRDGHLIWPPGPSGSTTDQWEASQPRGGRAPVWGLPGCPPARQVLSRLGPVSGLQELQPPWARPGWVCVGGTAVSESVAWGLACAPALRTTGPGQAAHLQPWHCPVLAPCQPRGDSRWPCLTGRRAGLVWHGLGPWPSAWREAPCWSGSGWTCAWPAA